MTLGATLLNLSGCSFSKTPRPSLNLVTDPNGICDLPQGFTYTILSRYADTMSDGPVVPDYHDGMGCFTGPAGEIILVRNHEIPLYFPTNPPSPEPRHAYDPDASGGTTTIWLNDRLEVIQPYLSLTGTIRNCSGGTTPWGTWISCEEAGNEGWMMGKRHGYNIAANTQSEWCGACFLPDGNVLFANIFKKPGMTLAIQGPWEWLRAAA